MVAGALVFLLRAPKGVLCLCEKMYGKVVRSLHTITEYNGTLVCAYTSYPIQMLNQERVTGLILINLEPQAMSWTSPAWLSGKVIYGDTYTFSLAITVINMSESKLRGGLHSTELIVWEGDPRVGVIYSA